MLIGISRVEGGLGKGADLEQPGIVAIETHELYANRQTTGADARR